VTALNSPRTGVIGSTSNKLSCLFTGLLTDYFLRVNTRHTTIKPTMECRDGVTGVSGIIEVTTTTNGPTAFKHTIVLKSNFENGNSTFYWVIIIPTVIC
jgi:hypothetical protein